MRFAELRGKASFSLAPVVVALHGSQASGLASARTVRYSFNARPKQSKPGPRFEVEAGTRTSIVTRDSSTQIQLHKVEAPPGLWSSRTCREVVSRRQVQA